MRKVCEICGSEFEATRSTARFCSGKCRMASHRLEKAGIPPIVSREQVEREAVRQAHDTAADLSRASRLAPAPRCRVYRDLAQHIEDELEGIGL